MRNKILIILLILFFSFCFFVLFKSLQGSSIYVPEKKQDRQLSEFVSEDLLNKKKLHLKKYFKEVIITF